MYGQESRSGFTGFLQCDMPQPLYAKKLEAARLHPIYIKSCYMPRLLYAEKLQAACMQLLNMLS
jgi:hypothetical protein